MSEPIDNATVIQFRNWPVIVWHGLLSSWAIAMVGIFCGSITQWTSLGVIVFASVVWCIAALCLVRWLTSCIMLTRDVVLIRGVVRTQEIGFGSIKKVRERLNAPTYIEFGYSTVPVHPVYPGLEMMDGKTIRLPPVGWFERKNGDLRNRQHGNGGRVIEALQAHLDEHSGRRDQPA